MTRAPAILAFLVLTTSLLVPAPARAQTDEATSEFKKHGALFVQHCMKCHTVGQGDRVGPDLEDVSLRRDREWLIGFITQPGEYLDNDPIARQLLRAYDDVRMTDLGISRPQAEGLLNFIETLSEGGPGILGGVIPLEEVRISRKVDLPDEGFGVSRSGMTLLAGLLILAGAAWKLGAARSAQVLIVIALGVGYWSLGGRGHHHLTGNDQGYEPTQPIPFSHALHAGDNEISCLYCHHGAERGPVAGIPSVNICMNCHKVVRRRTDVFETSGDIAKVVEAWESRQSGSPKPIDWVRVHNLPDYVFFNHQVHVTGGIECQECHGAVEEMETIRQASNLTMGWCVNCHRRVGRAAPAHWKRSDASLDCSACHQ